jgi:hypothetical protein
LQLRVAHLRICDYYSFLAPTIRKCANAQLQANSQIWKQIWKILASRRLGTKSLVGPPLGCLDPNSLPGAPVGPGGVCDLGQRRGEREEVRGEVRGGGPADAPPAVVRVGTPHARFFGGFTFPDKPQPPRSRARTQLVRDQHRGERRRPGPAEG